MKKLWYAFLLLTTCLVVSCNNVDDLKEDISDLEKRVTSLETQIKDLNSNNEAIQALAKKGATITTINYDQEKGTYSIEMSDGKKLNLVENKSTTALFPIMGVDADGNWQVSYDNGNTFTTIELNGQPVSAVAEDGFTPQFRVNDAGYWEVNYGDGFVAVKDINDNLVSAKGEGQVAQDQFFEDVIVRGNELYIKLKDEYNTEITVPIAPDFECKFIDAEGNVITDIHTIFEGETVEFKVKMKGVDNAIVTVPEGWRYRLGEPASDHIAILSLTAPESSVTTRAVADNSKDVSILATANTFACIAKMQVEAKKRIDYKKMYEEGTLVIGGVAVNKTTFPNVQDVASETDLATLITNIKNDATVLFLNGNYTLNSKGTVNGKVAIIGRYADSQSKIKVSGGNSYCPLQAAGGQLLWKNLSVDATVRTNYLLNQESKAAEFGTLAIENCEIYLGGNLAYFNIATGSVANISIRETKLQYQTVATTDTRIISLGSNAVTSSFKSFAFINNIVYNKTIMKGSIWAEAKTVLNVSDKNMLIKNNTFVNYLSNTAYMRLTSIHDLTMMNNIFFTDGKGETNVSESNLYVPISGAGSMMVNNNKVYDNSGVMKWYDTNVKGSRVEITPETATPFSEFDLTKGIFVSKDPNYGPAQE